MMGGIFGPSASGMDQSGQCHSMQSIPGGKKKMPIPQLYHQESHFTPWKES